MPVIVIPLWFYEFGSIMYFLASAIAFLISYFSFRLYSYTSSRQHLLLMLAFSFITIGMLILTIGNIVSFFNFDECKPHCRIDPTDPSYLLIRFGNYGYYLTSLIGYGLLALSYFRINFSQQFALLSTGSRSATRKTRKIVKTRKTLSAFSLSLFLLPVILPAVDVNVLFQTQEVSVLYPFVNPFFQTFHVLSSVLLAYIIFQILPNYLRHKSKLSRLVLLSFLAILSYHILMYILPISATFFALAHFALLGGFGMLLLLLIRVNADERRERKQGKFAKV